MLWGSAIREQEESTEGDKALGIVNLQTWQIQIWLDAPSSYLLLKKDVYERYGYFDTDFRVASDYELMLRFLEKYKISTHYIPEVLVKMRMGGNSNKNFKNMMIKSFEDYKAWKVNGLRGGVYTILLKNLTKVPQFFKRK